MWGARYSGLRRVERPNKPLQSHLEVKKLELVPGRMKGRGGDMEEIPVCWRHCLKKREGEGEREKHAHSRFSLPSTLQAPPVLSLAEFSSEPASKLVTREM